MEAKEIRTAERMLMLQKEFGASWKEISTLWQISKPVAWRFAKKGYKPKDNAIRKKLGLPIKVFQWRDPITGRFVEHEE